MKFKPEPDYKHGSETRTAILLVNLGTPEAATANAVRRYLAEFLSDPRVVEIPQALWKIILHGWVLRTRPSRSAAKYASIWMPEGSPLKTHTMNQAKLLRGYLSDRDVSVDVAYAMRYGSPGIADVLDALKARGVDRILLLPLYPQYSGTTTAAVMDEVSRWMLSTRNQPELRTVKHFHDDVGYIEALATAVHDYWQKHGWPEKLVMSFHGVPERTLLRGDPYHCECRKTARLLAEQLKLEPEQYVVTFQSRFGRAKWLRPYTVSMLGKLARHGSKRVDVICPGFVSDCLETLEEIGIEGKQQFLKFGGSEFHLIPCLNTQDAWIHALADIAQQHLQGWGVQRLHDAGLRNSERAAREQSRKLAQECGAVD
ncbi:MAG: ferrochelatase [Burkholderiaceae bacterium]|nr:MAG: ferrochelatase [Burkholderiaceae bacterium]